MNRAIDDCAKRRLIDRREIEFAIRFMKNRGVALDDVPAQLTRYYYVDMDEVNAILREMIAAEKPAAEPQKPATTAPRKLRNVA